MEQEYLQIKIPVKKYIDLIDTIDGKDWNIADTFHITMLNHMDKKSVRLYMNKKYSNVLDEMESK